MCVSLFVYSCVVFPVLQVMGFYISMLRIFVPHSQSVLLILLKLSKGVKEFPASSSMSMKNDNSGDYPPLFSHEPVPSGTK